MRGDVMRASVKYTDNDIDDDMKLTRQDYIKIIHHYQPRRRGDKGKITLSSVKERAQHILAGKLCKCIKTNGARAETRRLGICSNAIFNRRGLRQHGFRCKTKRGTLRPRLTRDITKTARRLTIQQ